MNVMEMPYEEAHDLINTLYDWENKLFTSSGGADVAKQVIQTKVVENTEKQLVKEATKKSTEQLALPVPKQHPLLVAPLKPKKPNIKPATALSKAQRGLAKKPGGKIPQDSTRRTAGRESLQTEKSGNQPTSRRNNRGKQVEQTQTVNEPVQDQIKSDIKTQDLKPSEQATSHPNEVIKYTEQASTSNKNETLLQKIEQNSSTQIVPSQKSLNQEIPIDHSVVNNIRTGKALKTDKNHAFPDVVDNFAQQAEKFNIKGGDGIIRELYQVEGSLRGQNSIFEWIVDPRPSYGITHRFFIKNGKITGKANIW